MTEKQLLKNLQVPDRKVDVVLDTDAYNEIDDQFAISYLLKSGDKLNTKAIYAAPFHNARSNGPEDGMLKSYDEILKLLNFLNISVPAFKGSVDFLHSETEPIVSDAANDLISRAKNYSPENPLYVVAIGAITNVASALIMAPEIAENLVIVWLGGHAQHFPHTKEFNMCHDYDAANVVLKSDAAFVQLPCLGVVSEFKISKPELEYWLYDKNPLADYLSRETVTEAEKYASPTIPWTRVIWDVTAVAWLLNDDNKFMQTKILPTPTVTKEGQYVYNEKAKPFCYVNYINRDALMNDLFKKILNI